MKTLIYSDSLCYNLPVGTDIHIESYPGRTIESVIKTELDNTPSSLTFHLQEDSYDCVIICFGVNDLANGRPRESVVDDLLYLHQICRQHGILKIIAMFLDPDYHNLFNQLYEEQSLDDIQFCEFFLNLESGDLDPDGLHPSHQGKLKLVQELMVL